jgi:hypothetical protein
MCLLVLVLVCRVWHAVAEYPVRHAGHNDEIADGFREAVSTRRELRDQHFGKADWALVGVSLKVTADPPYV